MTFVYSKMDETNKGPPQKPLLASKSKPNGSRQFVVATVHRRLVTPKGALVRESDPQNGRNIQVKDLE